MSLFSNRDLLHTTVMLRLCYCWKLRPLVAIKSYWSFNSHVRLNICAQVCNSLQTMPKQATCLAYIF